ncbi:hypothetical protein [Argonema galeatum]|uniref:hypothetical protein n=1 Tax=Argonema galeatum TaxID=2942762 RepID=UPI0020127A92|nr:hypothetical protein [Argonema galeatum]MCL1464863.1 hypothetical protein [Argonema galeatum A003/A1]
MASHQTVFRKFTTLFLALTLCWTTVACGGNSTSNRQYNQNSPARSAPTKINPGEYPVQQASYNDANGEYSLFLLNTQPGTPSTFRTTDLQMASLTPEEVSAGKKSYLKVENGQTSLHLKEDFKIEYIHAVTETRTDPQTGQPQTVIVRQQSSGFWAPFAGAVAGNLVSGLLFRPQYYVPPVYQPGVSVMTGYGGYGSTYNQAVGQYQTRYQTPPPAVRNRQSTLRTTGNIRNSPSSRPSYTSPSRPSTTNRPTGSGFGSSTLRQSGRSQPSRNPSSSFGSGGRSRSSGFGSRKR